VLAFYLALVYRTTRFQKHPPEGYSPLRPHAPFIVAMWHGEHFLIPFARENNDPAAALVSRHPDGAFNAYALEKLGVQTIRGSGARGRTKRRQGGAQAMLALLRALKQGTMVVLTADVPKTSRVCGDGIVQLAKMAQRPIVPIMMRTKAHITLKSWDRARIPLPFSRGVIRIGDPVWIAPDADAEAFENARQHVEQQLNALHALDF
jgi:lysophospholipid acyltransferase (LPLAT)-like uncharacterized protein